MISLSTLMYKRIIKNRYKNTPAARTYRFLLSVWRRLDTPLDAIIPGGDAGLLILTTIGSVLAYTGVMMVLINEIAVGFVPLITDVPRFGLEIAADGTESGNFSYLMYSLFSEMSTGFFILVFLIFGILLVLKKTEIVTTEAMKSMVKSAFVGIFLVLVFPYMWDSISDTSENMALFALNPLYSFDDDDPCTTSEHRLVVQFADFHRIMKEKSSVGGIVTDADSICSPDLKPNYLFAKAIFGASYDVKFEPDSEDGEWWNVLDYITAQVTTIVQGIFGIMFEGITKTTILFFLASMSALVSSMRHLLTDVIAISLPILLALRCIPFWGIDKMANTLTSVFVPLLFIPFFTAIIISAGSASLLAEEMEAGIIDSPDDLSSLATDRYLFWMYSIATLSLAVMTPVMFVPMLGSVASMMGKMVMTGTMTGVMGAAGAAQGVIQGGAAAASGLAAGGKMGKMGALKSVFSNPGAMGSILGGMGSGGVAAARGAFQNDLGGANKIMPGAGGSRNMFGGNSQPAGGEGSAAYAKGYTQGQNIASDGEIGQNGGGDNGGGSNNADTDSGSAVGNLVSSGGSNSGGGGNDNNNDGNNDGNNDDSNDDNGRGFEKANQKKDKGDVSKKSKGE